MGRPLRAAPGGLVYHVLNRANGRQRLFDDDGDYAAFERVLHEAQQRIAMAFWPIVSCPTIGIWCCGLIGAVISHAS